MDEQRRDVVFTEHDEVIDRGGHGIKRSSYRLRASTRIAKPKASKAVADQPQLGDPWCSLTVIARLQRMADVFRRMPHTPDTKPQGHRSCMPDIVRELFKDQPGEPMRLRVGNDDYTAAMQTLDSFVTLNRLFKIVGWHIACKIGDRRLGKYIRRDRKTAAALKQLLISRLITDWNARGWKPDQEDIENAGQLIRRKID